MLTQSFGVKCRTVTSYTYTIDVSALRVCLNNAVFGVRFDADPAMWSPDVVELDKQVSAHSTPVNTFKQFSFFIKQRPVYLTLVMMVC